MIYLPDYDLAILHIPRTGGNWLIHAIDQLGISYEVHHMISYPRRYYRKPTLNKHLLLAHLNRQFKKVAAFVRHPLSYYESIWAFLVKARSLRSFLGRSRKYVWNPFLIPFAATFDRHQPPPTLQAFVERMTVRHSGWATHLFEQYVGPFKSEFCDFIGRAETIVEDLEQLLGWLGIPCSLDRLAPVRVNCRKIPPQEWTAEMRQAVLRSEHRAIEQWYGRHTKPSRWYEKKWEWTSF